jgi:hypothetical protein
LDHKTISFLVNQMRHELERIPKENKRALLEAQTKCRVDEFSNARLERFLRCEGMNTKVRLEACTVFRSCLLPRNGSAHLLSISHCELSRLERSVLWTTGKAVGKCLDLRSLCCPWPWVRLYVMTWSPLKLVCCGYFLSWMHQGGNSFSWNHIAIWRKGTRQKAL